MGLTSRRYDVHDTRFEPGDVLFGKRRAYQRKVAVADFDGVCSARHYVLEAKPEHLLPSCCRSSARQTMLHRACDRAFGWLALTDESIGRASLRYEFALPPLEEQRRIAEVCRLRPALRSALDDVRRLARAVRLLARLERCFGAHQADRSRSADRVHAVTRRHSSKRSEARRLERSPLLYDRTQRSSVCGSHSTMMSRSSTSCSRGDIKSQLERRFANRASPGTSGNRVSYQRDAQTDRSRR